MGIVRRPAATSAVVVALAIGTPAHAQPTSQVKSRAQQLAKDAAAKSQAGSHDEAIDLYNQAYMLVPVPLLLSDIGAEYEQEGKRSDAVRYFCRYLKDDPAGPAASYASTQVKDLQGQLGNTIDDKDPCTVKPKPAAVATATTTPPPPPTNPAPPPVQHVELKSASSGEPETGAPMMGSTSGEPVDGPSRTVEYAGIGVASAGAIATGVGVYYAVKGLDLSNAISGHKQGTAWPSSIDGVNIADWSSTGHSDNVNAEVFSIAGGVALVGGVALFLVGRPGPEDKRIAITPIATGSTWGMSASGRF
jgi:tetratricopeptide (TPR) repeat protein